MPRAIILFLVSFLPILILRSPPSRDLPRLRPGKNIAILLLQNVLQTESLINWERERWYEDRAEGGDTPGDGNDGDEYAAEDSRLEPHLL